MHLKCVKKFYNKQTKVLTLCRDREDIGGILFNNMQWLAPKIPVQEMFYLRKLLLNVFWIHDC